MPKVTVLHNQSLLDIALTESGNANNWLEIAVLNNLVPTDVTTPGTVVEIPTNIDVDRSIVNFFKVKNIKPATAIATTGDVVVTPALSCQEQIENYFINPCN